jgi:signal transduction histidine kinase
MGHDRVVRGLRADGSEFPLDATISTINYHGQRRYVAVVRDVTERVRMANELKASHDSLRELSAALQSIREEEKTRIARELHDELGQALTALKMDASAIAGELAPHQGELIRRANGMKALIDSTVAAVRRISADLRPVMLDSLGLAPTLEWLSRDFEAHSGIKVMLDVPDEDMGAGNDAATAVFRIAQEALTNVARHARARTVRIALAREADALRLTVTDDGVGMADARQGDVRKARSFGLLGMRERATVLGGQFSVKKGPRGGTVVEAVVPADAGAGRSTS